MRSLRRDSVVMTDKRSNTQFELIVEALRPWAVRAERQVIREARRARCLVVLAFVAVALVLAVGLWQFWASMPALHSR